MTAPAPTRTCYRHGDRPAGISCQRCERTICPSCMHQASVGFHCPECARTGKQKVLQGRATWTTQPLVTQIVIGIAVLGAVGVAVTTSVDAVSEGGRFLASRVPDRPGLFADGALWGPAVPDEPWRLVTGGLIDQPLPEGLISLVFTVLLLARFGLRLEPIIGRWPMASLYAAGLGIGALATVSLDPEQLSADTSGLVFGAVGGTLVVARDRDLDLWRFGLPLVVFKVFFILSGSTAAVAPAVGGFLGGLIGGVMVTEGARRMGRRGDLAAAAVTGGVAVVGLVVAYARMAGEYGSL